MGLRDRLRKLEHEAEGEMIVITQQDGTVRRFPPEAGIEAFMNHMTRLGAAEHAPPEHPLIEAARNSTDRKWSTSFFATDDPDEWIKPVPDLSE